MGISKARGFVLADRLAGRRGRVFVLTGDGELQEGQFWESLQPTANRGLGEITVIVDHNKLQSDTWVAAGQRPRRPRGARSRAFGWAVARCDGNDLARVRGDARRRCATRRATARSCSIADTVKGAGVSFMEPHDLPHDRRPRSTASTPARRAPTSTSAALAELREPPERAAGALGAEPVALDEARAAEHRPAPPSAPAARRRLRRGARRAGRARSRGSSRSTPTSYSTRA